MMVEGIKDATDKGVVVVITTRTHGGRPYQVYAYPGSVTDSRNKGNPWRRNLSCKSSS